MERGGSVYIVTNKYHTVLYTGVTSDLISRVIKHREKLYPHSFSVRYNTTKLVYYQNFSSVEEAIDKEKQIKAGSRQKKLDLIELINPDWRDLYEDIKDW